MDNTDKKTYRIDKSQSEAHWWGYLIVLGMALPLCCACGSIGSFGLMFNDFITDLGGESGAVTVVIGFFAIALSFAGLLSSVLFKAFSVRSVGLIGCTIYSLGSVLTIFITSITQLIIVYGVMQGGGFGIMISVGYTTFNEYFVNKRRAFLMMGMAHTFIGIGMVVHPIAVHYLIEYYGFRGMTAIIAAINFHTIFAMIIMHPKKWHYKINKIPVDETNSLINSTKTEDNVKSENVRDIELAKMEYNVMNLESRSNNKFPQRNGTWHTIVNSLDLSFLKEPIYLNISLGIALASCSDESFFSLQPMYMYELGFSKAQAASVVATGAAADLFSRIFLTFITLFIQVKARYLYLAGVILTILLRFVFLNIRDFMGMTIIAAMMSFFRTWMHLPVPLVFADYLPQERFAAGYGLFMFWQGSVGFFVFPMVGWIRDVTQSYVSCFHSLTIIMSMCAISWTFEICWFKIYPNKV